MCTDTLYPSEVKTRARYAAAGRWRLKAETVIRWPRVPERVTSSSARARCGALGVPAGEGPRPSGQ